MSKIISKHFDSSCKEIKMLKELNKASMERANFSDDSLFSYMEEKYSPQE